MTSDVPARASSRVAVSRIRPRASIEDEGPETVVDTVNVREEDVVDDGFGEAPVPPSSEVNSSARNSSTTSAAPASSARRPSRHHAPPPSSGSLTRVDSGAESISASSARRLHSGVGRVTIRTSQGSSGRYSTTAMPRGR
ncbi:hypothetical protein PV689_00025 [Streptomyces sp. ATCC51928]|uniref:Uncharacterized protein n=1 Tax=Streptomyces caviscabies TaxID=90079 RepID=A0ABW2MF06_9ACTN|nr:MULTISPECIES: hypothetical protein [unclassified Streptomyces]MDX3500300.1 hypothetical protein [Streptomyces sp. ATCC51928]MDX5520361.1 hypothetical protein [Streptomyces sp. DE06-01C]